MSHPYIPPINSVHAHRPKAWIPFVNFAVVSEIPPELQLRDHLFPFEGMRLSDEYIWGIYGTMSANQSLFLVDAYARKQGLMPLTIQGWYRVDNFDLVRSQINQEVAEQSGYLHTERLKSVFRDELHALILSNAKHYIDAFNVDAFKDLSLNDILLTYPCLIDIIFENFPKINMIVHPVHQLYDSNDRKVFSIATMRMIPSRVMTVQVRYLDDRVKVLF